MEVCFLGGGGADSERIEGSDSQLYLTCKVVDDWFYPQGGAAASQAALPC